MLRPDEILHSQILVLYVLLPIMNYPHEYPYSKKIEYYEEIIQYFLSIDSFVIEDCYLQRYELALALYYTEKETGI